MICVAILENKRKKFWGEISISFVWCSITLFPNPNYSLETEKYWLNRWIDLTYNISTTSTYFWLCTYRNLTMWGKLFQYLNVIFIEFHHVKIFCLISLCRAAGSPWKEWTGVPYLFTYKTHSVIRRTLNFRRRLWQVSKIKISPKYPVIRRTQNYGKILLTTFAILTTICFQKLLITVLSLSKQKRKSNTLQTIAKKVTHRQ